MSRFSSPAVPQAGRPGTTRRRGVSYHWRGGRDARGLDLRPEPPKPPPEPPRIMMLTSELPRSTDASGAISSRFISGGCGEADARADGEGTEFLGDGEVTSL